MVSKPKVAVGGLSHLDGWEADLDCQEPGGKNIQDQRNLEKDFGEALVRGL